MASAEDIARGIIGGVSGFFGFDEPNDDSVVVPTVQSMPPATSATSQPQTVAPVGDGVAVLAGVPTWAWIAGGLLAVGVVVAVVSD